MTKKKMSDSEILSITALSALGICLLVGLAKMAMKKQGHQETCDKVCGSLIFLAVVLMGVSQLLGEVSNFETVVCAGHCEAMPETVCHCPSGETSCKDNACGLAGDSTCLCKSGPEEKGYCCSALDAGCKTGPRCTTTSDCASNMSCYHPDESEDESSSPSPSERKRYTPKQGHLIPCRKNSQCKRGLWDSTGDFDCQGDACNFKSIVPVTCKASPGTPSPARQRCNTHPDLAGCSADTNCTYTVKTQEQGGIYCDRDTYKCGIYGEPHVCSGSEDIGEGVNPFGPCESGKGDCGVCSINHTQPGYPGI